jgi:hypothetical protein
MGNSKTIGSLMLLGAVIIAALGLAVVVPRYFSEELTLSATILGAVIALVIALPLAGAGVYMIVRGQAVAQDETEAKQQRRLLDMVTTRGQVSLSDAAIELQAPRAQVKNWVYRLVGLGVFTGYINWDDGTLFSAEAAQLRDLTACKKCGGNVKLAGKGVVKCPYCGTEYFLA